MSYRSLQEERQHGSADFPLMLYHVDEHSANYVMAFHWHLEYELVEILAGSLLISLDGREYIVGAGDLLFINSGMVHGGFPDHCRYRCLVFHGDLLARPRDDRPARLLTGLADRCTTPYFPARQDAFHTVAAALFEAVEQQSAGYELLVCGLLYQLFGILTTLPTVEGASKAPLALDSSLARFKQVLEWIGERYDKPVTLSQMAAVAGMTPAYFCSFFRSFAHRTPVDYLNFYRMECACRALTAEGRTVTEAAFDCGFRDLSYFIKTFKRYKGVTPHQYVKIVGSFTQKE